MLPEYSSQTSAFLVRFLIIFPVPVNIISYPYSLRVKETVQRVINDNICLFFIGKHLTVTGMDQQATHKKQYIYLNKYRSGSGSKTSVNWPKCQTKHNYRNIFQKIINMKAHSPIFHKFLSQSVSHSGISNFPTSSGLGYLL